MKDLTFDEAKAAPSIVMALYALGVAKMPVSSSMLTEAMEKHPEYFPDEIAYQKKCQKVPQFVWDAYHKEVAKAFKEAYAGIETGIVAIARTDLIKTASAEYQKRSRVISEEYLGKYGLGDYTI